MMAARAWGQWAFGAGDAVSAAEGYAAGVALLPQVAWHGLDRVTREEQLASWAGMAADAAACAITAGQLGRAVEVLEQGRSVLWTEALHLRSDLTRLREHDPDLAARLDEVRRELDRPLPNTAVGRPEVLSAERQAAVVRAAQEQTVADRRHLARQWDDLIAQVRRIDGFENFLQAIPFTELAAAAAGGSVVIVNVSQLGCHALIVTANGDPGVQKVPLPDLTHADAVDRANTLLGVLSRADQTGRPFLDAEADRHAVFDVLDWLWRVIAVPVLDTLRPATPPGGGAALPRVWWCPTGPLTMLPLHAAGHYSRTTTVPTPPEQTVPGRVVSSYTPTLTGQRRAREAPAVPPGAARQLVVGMPIAPGQQPLPAVPAELQVLTDYFPPPRQARHLVAEQATRETVQSVLADYPWVHLACHAYQNQANPDSSAFALWDGPLTLAGLTTLRTRRAELAFLSACQTAAGTSRLPDEALHLAAAMQLLGYRHVIASLWTIADAPTPDVAKGVYAPLSHTGHPDASQAAEALHHAVEALRNANPDRPLLWAPYIHIGP